MSRPWDGWIPNTTPDEAAADQQGGGAATIAPAAAPDAFPSDAPSHGGQIRRAGVPTKGGMLRTGFGRQAPVVLSPSALAADVNDYGPTGLAASTALRLSTSGGADYNVTGLSAVGIYDGQRIVLRNTNTTTGNITAVAQSTSSVAANRFALTSDLAIKPLTAAAFVYSTSDARWHLDQQGAGAAMLKTAATGLFVSPDLNTGISVAVSASSNTFGSWTELVASTSEADFILGFAISTTSASSLYTEVQIGTGGAGSESGVSTWRISSGGGGNFGKEIVFPVMIPIPTGTRIAARVADNVGASKTYNLGMILLKQTDIAAIAA